MNIWGLGAGPKFQALKHIFFYGRPKIIFIQETMHPASVTLAFFRKMFPKWHMVATDASSLSGGLAVIWDPTWIKASAFKCNVGIFISASIRGHSTSLNMLNIYAPCRDRTPFWEWLFGSEILDMDRIMLAGDFNVTLNADEVWGGGRKLDQLGERIRK